MRFSVASVFCLIIAGCSGPQAFEEGDPAPYRAVIAFEWPEEEPVAPDGGGTLLMSVNLAGQPAGTGEKSPDDAAARSTPLGRQRVEEEVLDGLEESFVFSDFLVATPETMEAVARREEADLLVLVRIGALGRWEGTHRIVPGLATLGSLLWVGTGIGGWWIPDREYPTSSDVEVAWKRPLAEPAAAEEDSGAGGRDDFRLNERLLSGEYRLSFWNRAKPWRQPLAYLMNLVVPPVLVPVQDRSEMERLLALAALEDITRELARKLKGGSIRSGGAPFLFRLEGPRNGAVVRDDSAPIRYQYQVEAGFEEHQATMLSELAIDLMPGDSNEYVRLREYTGDAIQAINERIQRGETIEETVHDLRPGWNLIRFVALTEFRPQRITNTVTLLRE